MPRAAASLSSSASPRTAASFASAAGARDAAGLASAASARAAAALANVGGESVYADGIYEPGIYEDGGGTVIYLPAASLGGSASLRDRGFLQAAIPPAVTVTLSGEVVTYLGSPVTVDE